MIFFKNRLNQVELTLGGLILQMPAFSACGRILLRYASGSLNSSSVGVNTGASSGLVNLKSAIAYELQNRAYDQLTE